MASFPKRITDQGSGSGFSALEGQIYPQGGFKETRRGKGRARLGAPVLCLLQRWKCHGKCKEEGQSSSASGCEKSKNTWAKQRPLGEATTCRRQENHSPGSGRNLVNQRVQGGASMNKQGKIIHEQKQRKDHP